MEGSGQTVQKNKLSLVGLPGGKCVNAHRGRRPIHKKDRGEGAACWRCTRLERERGRERKNSGGRMIAPPKTKPSRAAHSWRKVRKRAQGVSPPKCEVLNRAQGTLPCSQKAWGMGTLSVWGQAEGKPYPAPKEACPGKGKRKSPRVGAWVVSRSRRS